MFPPTGLLFTVQVLRLLRPDEQSGFQLVHTPPLVSGLKCKRFFIADAVSVSSRRHETVLDMSFRRSDIPFLIDNFRHVDNLDILILVPPLVIAEETVASSI